MGGPNQKREPARAAELADRLAFPFGTLRPGQDLMTRDIAGAVASGLTLLCSAPTGIGKTAAVLYPTLKHALAEGCRVFFTTAKNSQQQLALDTLRRMIAPASGVCAVQIGSKERSCPRDGRRCRDLACRYLERFQDRLRRSGLLEELCALGVVSAAEVRERALAHDLCPFEVSLSLAEGAHVVVSDFNYVFEPNVYLRRFFDAPYDRDLLVVDEAHNLPVRAVGYYSPELDLVRMRDVAERCLSLDLGVFRAAGVALTELVDACESTLVQLGEERDAPPPWVEPPDRPLFERIGARIDDAIAGYVALLSAGGRAPPEFAPPAAAASPRERDPLLALLFAVRDFCRCCEADPELFAALWAPGQVKLSCLDPAPFLRERLQGFRAAVFMSATLTPFEFARSRLGADDREVLTLDLPCPFPRANRLLVSVPSVDTTYRQRSADAAKIAALISETSALRAGNYLAFFPSFAYRDEVVSQLAPGPRRLLLQLPGAPAAATLGLLRDRPAEPTILCAVHGGIFAEGVDYPGDMAIGVFVVGPGLPAVSAEQQLVRGYYEAQLGAGFEYAYVYPGLGRVVQAGGRAIRTPSDRAFIMLLGRRFSEPLYRSKLPAWWQEEIIDSEDPIPLVRAFWRGG